MQILVIEGDPGIRDLLLRGLRGGADVVDVQLNWHGGLYESAENPYDVVILGAVFPDCCEVLRAIRARDDQVPILIFGSQGRGCDEQDALDLGAADYLVKPFSLVVVKAYLRALEPRLPTERHARLTLGDLLIDSAGHRVTQRGNELHLTAREFALLRFLVANPNTVLSRHEILENVWDRLDDGTPNVVEVYVGYLRRKLGSSPGSPQIETLRGAGYRIVELAQVV